jgi:diaminopimelate decarboxylase
MMHSYTLLNLYNKNIFRHSTQILVELHRKLRDRFPAMKILNLGGGLGIPYKEQVT